MGKTKDFIYGIIFGKFTCDGCKKTYPKEEWTDKRAKAEFKRHFPKDNFENSAITCDDCFEEVLKYKQTLDN